jgi:hypothetical protein
MAKSSGHGGRRKGAGRPRFAPTGKTAYFNTRLAPKTRRLLEAEARRQGKSLSEVAENLLELGLEEIAELRRPRPLRGLLFLVEQLDQDLARQISRHGKYSWASPYCFGEFRSGVLEILDALRPKGKAVPPPGELEGYEPAFLGRASARFIIGSARRIEQSHGEGSLFEKLALAADPREYYGIVDSIRALGLQSTSKKGG